MLSEYQALEGLLVPSGDNIADRLAVWDAGSINGSGREDERASEGVRSSARRTTPIRAGWIRTSASTAADQAYVAAQLMADPAVRATGHADQPSRRRDPLEPQPGAGVDGIIGSRVASPPTRHLFGHRGISPAPRRARHLGQPRSERCACGGPPRRDAPRSGDGVAARAHARREHRQRRHTSHPKLGGDDARIRHSLAGPLGRRVARAPLE